MARTTPGSTLTITGTPTYALTDRAGTTKASGNCDAWDTAAKQAPEASVTLSTAALDAGEYDLLITMVVVGSDTKSRTIVVRCIVEVSDSPPWPVVSP
jgi:hypothetical protein